jgi:hypothetical protein
MTSQPEEVARATFSVIVAEFPALSYAEDSAYPGEIAVLFPEQHGLSHEVRLSLGGEDELQFSVGNFFLEWFPCTEQERKEAYIQAVCGFLRGQYGVVEYWRGGSCIKARLQRPSSSGWETIGTWSRLRWPSFLKPEQRVLANA